MNHAVRHCIESMFASVDARRWPDVVRHFTPTVDVDYSDLDGPRDHLAAAELVAGWEAFLPRFDCTVHALHDLTVHVAGPRATATATAIAVHTLGEQCTVRHWTVFADYDLELEQTGGDWAIARIRLVLREQHGDLDLPAVALGREPTAQPPALELASVRAFFDALRANDRAALRATLAEDVVQHMPLAPAGFPREVAGRDALEALYGNIIDREQDYETAWHGTSHPRTVVVSFEGSVRLDDGSRYRNRYVNLFTVDDEGRIRRIVEHFDPDTLLARWPGLQPPHHSVHASGASTDTVAVRRVTFASEGAALVGHLFTPSDSARRTGPAVIVTGSWTSVKEQMPDVYASRLAEQGLTTLTFDFAGFGESGGEPRQLEDPERKIRDIRAAARWLRAQPGVETVVGLGICASAGYQAHAAADGSLDRLLLVAPWLHDETLARGIYDGRPGGSDGLVAASRAATPGEVVLAASELDPLAAMYVPEHAFDYYLNPAQGAGPHYDNRFAVAGWEGWITFDAISAARALTLPVHVVHSEQGAIPEGTKRFVAQLTAPHTVTWLDAFTQQQLYADPAAVRAVLDDVLSFLQG
ncbi:MAG: nuclear transport factor 2 family protein [Myxococcales bacterium]|nr:nuclear transport factor 2 family protein [Myxococcales bacterium]